MLGEAASRALRNSTPDPSFGGGPEFFLRRYGSRGRPECSGDRSRERERVVPGAGTGTRRERERERAGERAPGRGQERKRLKEQRQASGGGKPGDERRGGNRSGSDYRSGERPAGAEGRRGTSAGSNRKRCRTSPQGLNSGQTMPPSRMLTRNTPPPTSPRLYHHAACFCPAPPAPALFRKGRRGPPQGRAPAPIVPNTHNQPIAPNTHNRPIARTRTKKERHPLPDAAPWNGCAVSTRGRRPYRPLRAGRRTRPAYWPQSTPR